MSYFAHKSSFVDDGATIGDGTKIWHFCHIMPGAVLGERCNLGQNCFVADGVRLGANVKVQNNVSIYTGTEIEDDVFLGPSCVLTNVTNPRSQVNRHSLYETTLIRRGASIGANATVVCGVTIGRYAFIAAGAVITGDAPDYALMMGVPARRRGWVSRHGIPLPEPGADGLTTCPESGLRYQLEDGRLRCLDVDEDAPLPEDQRTGTVSYREVRPRERGE
ncbi:N-acetyltransferase [bacterium]|nr:N-acetyltransferase [bacterium]